MLSGAAAVAHVVIAAIVEELLALGEVYAAAPALPVASTSDRPSLHQGVSEPCAMTNRMRELRSCGSVRAEDSNVLGYSDVSVVRFRPWPP